MTPNDIEILIHCHCCSELHPRFDAPAVRESMLQMQEDGLIYSDEDGILRTTERGRAHLLQMMALPLPRAIWVDAHGDEINTVGP